MTRISVSRVLDLPPEDVWTVLADFPNVANFHPYIERALIQTPHRQGLGATRRCEWYDGGHAVEQVSRWAQGRELGVRVLETSMPVRDMEIRMCLFPRSDGRTLARLEMDCARQTGHFGQRVEKVLLQRLMRHRFARVLESLEHHARTGELIGRGGRRLGRFAHAA